MLHSWSFAEQEVSRPPSSERIWSICIRRCVNISFNSSNRSSASFNVMFFTRRFESVFLLSFICTLPARFAIKARKTKRIKKLEPEDDAISRRCKLLKNDQVIRMIQTRMEYCWIYLQKKMANCPFLSVLTTNFKAPGLVRTSGVSKLTDDSDSRCLNPSMLSVRFQGGADINSEMCSIRSVWLTWLQLHQDYTIDSDLKSQIVLFASPQPGTVLADFRSLQVRTN